MAGESNIVDLAISVQDQVPKLPDIQTILVVGDTGGAWYGVRTYSADPDGLVALDEDIDDVDNAVYKIVSALSVEGGISTVKVFSRQTPNVQEVELVPQVLTPGFEYYFEVNGVAVTHTNGASESVDTLCDAFATQLNAIDGVVATPDNATATKLALEPDTGAQRIRFSNVRRGLALTDVSADAGIAAELASAMSEDSDWSHLILDSTAPAELQAAATYCATNGRILWALSINDNLVKTGSSDLASLLASNNSVLVLFTQDTNAFGALSGISTYLTYHPGNANVHMWSQISVGNPLRKVSPTEVGFADSKRVTLHTTVNGVTAFYGNRAPGGRVITTQQALNYLSSIIKSDVITAMLVAPTIQFTPEGMAQLEEVVRNRLKREEDKRMLVPGSSSVKVVKYEDTTIAERGNGLLDAIEFGARLAVSIDKVKIRGSLTI